jgi:2'-5' RNA ligase
VSDPPEAHDSNIVVLLPIDEQRQSLDSHVTIVYSGGRSERPAEESQMLQACRITSAMFKPFVVKVVGSDMLGPERSTPVWLLDPLHPDLGRLRAWFARFDRSDYPRFIPHMTVPSLSCPRPRYLILDRLSLWSADRRTTFSLSE